MTWAFVCKVTDFPPATARTLDINPPIAVFNVDGSFYAIDDTCTHEVWSLADGYIHGTQVECALHSARFDLRTGEAPPCCSFQRQRAQRGPHSVLRRA
jgi:3-phenylpropionate/trans-cinnamate dioxygenase ferredoxin component